MNHLQRLLLIWPLTILIHVVITIEVKAQTQIFSVSSLFHLYNTSQDQIEDIAIKKGYRFMDVSEMKNGFMIVYYINKNPQTPFLLLSLTHYKNDSELLEVGITTTSQSDYIKLKNQVKEYGYFFDKSEQRNYGEIVSYYIDSKQKYLVRTRQSFAKEQNENHYTVEIINYQAYKLAEEKAK